MANFLQSTSGAVGKRGMTERLSHPPPPVYICSDQLSNCGSALISMVEECSVIYGTKYSAYLLTACRLQVME